MQNQDPTLLRSSNANSQPDSPQPNSRIRNRGDLVALALCAILGSGPTVAFAADPSGQGVSDQWVRGRILVMPRAGLADSELGKIVGEHGGKAREIGKTRIYIVDLPPSASETAVIQQLSRNPHLKFAELDQRVAPGLVTNDPYAGSQWHLQKIGAQSAWDLSQGSGVTIAILDTGVDGSHPDLSAQMVSGWNFYDNNSNTSDVHGHGTAVAGAAAATTNNGAGVASVAGRSMIMPVRIADANAYASWSTVAQGLSYAADHGARVANISYVGVAGSLSVQNAAQYMKSKGGLVIVCAGNNGINENIAPNSTMIPVSATDSNDQLTSWSSYGNFVMISSPGQDIWTTTRGGGYQTWWGTSLASPVVAGTVALMMAAKPSAANTTVENFLYSTAVDLGAPGRDIYYGYGRVNAAAAVQAVAGSQSTLDAQPPTAAIPSPLSGSTVGGWVAVSASSTDNVGVTRVELRVNGATVATDTASPFSFSWDSTKTADGTATLTAVAYDAAGNSATSSPVSVNVANGTTTTDTIPPVVSLLSPAAGSRVKPKGSTTITAIATDNNGVSGISQSLYIDGLLVATASGGTLSYSWNMNRVGAGVHTIVAVAKDAAGNSASATGQISK